MDCHKADGLYQLRVWPRFTNDLLVERTTIKRLVLRPNGRKNIVSVEVFGCHHGKPKRGIRQSAMQPRKALVGDKASWINYDFASVEVRLQNIGNYFQ